MKVNTSSLSRASKTAPSAPLQAAAVQLRSPKPPDPKPSGPPSAQVATDAIARSLENRVYSSAVKDALRNPFAVVPGDQRKYDRTAELTAIVKANQQAIPQPGTRDRYKPGYGTNSFVPPSLGNSDRLGLGNGDPETGNLIDRINQRAGWGFNPERDLRINPGTALSHESAEVAALKKQIREMQKQINDLQGRMGRVETDVLNLKVSDMQRYQEKMREAAEKAVQSADKTNKAKNPNPMAPDNGGTDPSVINNLRSPVRIRTPFIDPVREDQTAPSLVLKVRGQAVDPIPDGGKNEGGAMKSILSTRDAVTDPIRGGDVLTANRIR